MQILLMWNRDRRRAQWWPTVVTAEQRSALRRGTRAGSTGLGPPAGGFHEDLQLSATVATVNRRPHKTRRIVINTLILLISLVPLQGLQGQHKSLPPTSFVDVLFFS